MNQEKIEDISSTKNQRIINIEKLLLSNQIRQAEHRFVVEGVRLVEEAVKSKWRIAEVYFSDRLSNRGKELLKVPALQNALKFHVSESVMKKISGTETPQGIVAVVCANAQPLPDHPDLLVILDAIRDPGNVGTILRTACAGKVNAVLVAPETADPYSPKVLRAGMGAQFNLPVFSLSWQAIAAWVKKQRGMRILLSDIRNGKNLWNVDLKHPLAFIISNEASGPGEEARKLADEIITIPMPGGGESLNAAVAASLLIYEVLRQRK